MTQPRSEMKRSFTGTDTVLKSLKLVPFVTVPIFPKEPTGDTGEGSKKMVPFPNLYTDSVASTRLMTKACENVGRSNVTRPIIYISIIFISPFVILLLIE